MTRGIIRGTIILGASLGLAATGSAAMVTFSVNNSDPFGAQSSFLAGANNYVTEDFEGFDAATNDQNESTNTGHYNPLVSTKVGAFSVSGDPGDKDNEACLDPCTSLVVLTNNAGGSPFGGRYDTSDGNGDDNGTGQWLDSNDVTAMQWDIGGTLANANAFGFFLMDPSDQGATLEVTFADGNQASQSVSISGEGSGELFYISAISDTPFASASVTFENVSGDIDGDGYGVDDVTVAQVPEPATLGLLGAGLMGLGFAPRRRRQV